MKTIGLIGGMSWQSTAEYYKIINEETNRRLGRHNSAKILLYSVNFNEIEKSMAKERWDLTGKILTSAATKLMSAGANCVMLCTNTMHMNADDVKRSVSIPFIHIADAVSFGIKDAGYTRAALIGTKFTMQEKFLKDKFIQNGISVITPTLPEMDTIHDIIFKELVKGVVSEQSRDTLLMIMDNLAEKGAQCAILGCTELGMIIKDTDSPLPLFDTTYYHSVAAVDFALSKP